MGSIFYILGHVMILYSGIDEQNLEDGKNCSLNENALLSWSLEASSKWLNLTIVELESRSD